MTTAEVQLLPSKHDRGKPYSSGPVGGASLSRSHICAQAGLPIYRTASPDTGSTR